MKISIDVKNFYMDENGDFEEQFKGYVSYQCKEKIWATIKAEVEAQIQLEVLKTINNELQKQIQGYVAKCIEGENIYPCGTNGKAVKLKDYIKDKFEHDTGYWSPLERLQTLAKTFAEELKKRYDLVFASQIVAKMNDNGLLKEQYARLLLEEKK